MLEDWINEASEALGIEADMDIDAVLDVARVVAHRIERRAAPLTAYLMGLALASHPETDLHSVSRKLIRLAQGWSRLESGNE